MKDVYLTGTSIIKYDFSFSDHPRYYYCYAYSWKAFRRKMTSIIAPHIQNSRWTICHKSCSVSNMTEIKDVNGLEQDYRISIANAMEILQSCTKQLMCWWNVCPNSTSIPTPQTNTDHISPVYFYNHRTIRYMWFVDTPETTIHTDHSMQTCVNKHTEVFMYSFNNVVKCKELLLDNFSHLGHRNSKLFLKNHTDKAKLSGKLDLTFNKENRIKCFKMVKKAKISLY